MGHEEGNPSSSTLLSRFELKSLDEAILATRGMARYATTV